MQWNIFLLVQKPRLSNFNDQILTFEKLELGNACHFSLTNDF